MIEIGAKIGGRYVIQRPIGSGGMANVFLAYDLILKREVAIKFLRIDFVHDEGAVRRFKREAIATSELNHPNIVAIYDIGTHDELQYIVMEYVDGPDLKEYIRDHSPLDFKEVQLIMQQLLDAIGVAHEQKIIHRDLKPQNIMLNQAGDIKVTDFGIAIILSETSITQTNTLLGSVHYVAPEQARGSISTNKSDIYSLGIILYELLTGKVPYDGETAVSIALKHFQEPMPDINKERADIPQALINVMLKASDKEMRNRYDSCCAMAADLATALDPSRANEAPYHTDDALAETMVIPTVMASSDEPKDSDHTQTMVLGSTEPFEPVVEEPPIFTNVTEPDENPKKEAKNRPIWQYFLFFTLGLVGLVTLFFVMWNVFTNTGKETAIPDIINMTQEEAIATLTEANLKVDEIKSQHDNEIPKGVVIQSNPRTNVKVKEGSEVDLIISAGMKPVSIGNLAGKKASDVIAELTAKKFKVTVNEVLNDEIESGRIISQNLDADGLFVPNETEVELTVSKGKHTYEMRDLTNYTKKEAQDFADQNKLSLSIQDNYSDTIETGLVMGQSIAVGSSYSVGDSLTITISLGVKPKEIYDFEVSVLLPYPNNANSTSESSVETHSSDASSSEGAHSSSSTTNEPVTFEIFIRDLNHDYNSVYRMLTITADTQIEIPFKLEEDTVGAYRIVRNGTTIEENTSVKP